MESDALFEEERIRDLVLHKALQIVDEPEISVYTTLIGKFFEFVHQADSVLRELHRADHYPTSFLGAL